MSKTTLKGGALLAPVPPVMVSCSDGEKNNILTIGWTGIVNTIPPVTYISVRPERYSYNIIKESGEFVINLATTSLARAVDFCGVRSGAKLDKFGEMNLTAQASTAVSCPLIKECPVNIECKVRKVIPIGSHTMFLADIVCVDVDDAIIDQNGRIMLDKAGLLAYAHGEYFSLGEKLGTFGFSVKKKNKKKKARK